MANARIAKQILADGRRNAVVQLVYELDTAGAFADAGAIALADFTNNEVPPIGALNGLRFDKIEYSVADAVTATLYWNATADQPIAAVSGANKLWYAPANGLIPNRAAAGYDGAIDVRISNIPAGAGAANVYTASLLLYMVKLYAVP